MKKSPEQQAALYEEQRDRLKYLNRKIRRTQKRVYWGLVLHLVIAAIALTWFAYIASQPTGDDRFKVKYCTLVNARNIERGTDTSKIWQCPRTEYR